MEFVICLITQCAQSIYCSIHASSKSAKVAEEYETTAALWSLPMTIGSFITFALVANTHIDLFSAWRVHHALEEQFPVTQLRRKLWKFLPFSTCFNLTCVVQKYLGDPSSDIEKTPSP